jgi:IS1 family transposase
MIIFMNRLPAAKRAQILQMLCEGNSMRSTSRMADVSINTVTKLLIDAGTLCAAFHDEMVRNVKSQRIQADEIWAFIGAKERAIRKDPTIKDRNEDAGDVWTWTAIDADTKLMVAYAVGPRNLPMAIDFMKQVQSRLAHRVQLTTDAYRLYLTAVDEAFMEEVDYAQLHKIYANDGRGKYSPPECIGCKPKVIIGDPDPAHISTSYVERANLTMRMSMRRFTRLTNAFSKKFENHSHMIALYTVWYNWVRIHKTLRVTPAMASGLTDRVWDFAEIIALMDQVTKPE